MKNILFVFCFFSISIFAQTSRYDEIDKIFSAWESNNEPGCAIGIVSDGELVYKKGYGIADLEHDIPITPQSVFYIGSVSKQFVTFCILLLEEEGKINLDDKIQKYLPDFPEYGTPLTIRHFIHHTSGVRDYLTLMYLKGRSYLDHLEVDEVYELIKSQKTLNFPPGDKYLYSNSCYFMLAMIVEKAAGESIRQYAEKNIFGPLEMYNTLFYDNNRDLIKNKAFSYEKNNIEGDFDNLIMRFALVGSGGVYSSIEDLYKWDQNFYNNKLGKGGQEIIGKMHEEGLLNNGESSGYAFALHNGEYKGLRTVSHGGALAGYRAELMRFPDERTSFIILANRADANPTGKTHQIADIILKDKLVEQIVQDSSRPKEMKKDISKYSFDQIIGNYEAQPGIIAEITKKEGKLFFLQKWDNTSYFLHHKEGNTYILEEEENLTFTFSELENDNIQKLTVLQGGNEIIAMRIEELKLSSINLEQYEGEYYSPELDFTYRIFTKNGKLRLKIGSMEDLELKASSVDQFSQEGNLLRFIRKGEKIQGFELDAGRVQNLKFEKSDD